MKVAGFQIDSNLPEDVQYFKRNQIERLGNKTSFLTVSVFYSRH